ncbi:DedA family protein [bacterium]|nr:DedA family protein [bacterium]
MGFLRKIYDWVMRCAPSPYALLALNLLSFSESSFFPIPPDPLLIAMSLAKPKRSLWYALWCSVSSVLGGVLGYVIGAFLWSVTKDFFFTYVPGFTPEGFATVEKLYLKYSFWCVFAAGFTPIPYKIFTIASGVFGMAFWPFIIASAVSRSARFFLVAGLIRIFGEKIKAFIDKYFNILTIAFLILLIGCFAIFGFLKKGDEQKDDGASTLKTSEVSE